MFLKYFSDFEPTLVKRFGAGGPGGRFEMNIRLNDCRITTSFQKIDAIAVARGANAHKMCERGIFHGPAPVAPDVLDDIAYGCGQSNI